MMMTIELTIIFCKLVRVLHIKEKLIECIQRKLWDATASKLIELVSIVNLKKEVDFISRWWGIEKNFYICGLTLEMALARE